MGEIVPLFDPDAVAGAKFKSPAVRAEIAELFPEGVAPGSISETDLADAAVTEPKHADASVTAPKIATGAVTNPKIATGAVTRAKMAAGAVGPDETDVGVVTAKDDAGNDMALTIVKIAAADYAALGTPDPNTEYHIY